VVSGLISLSFGFFLTYQIAIVDGLFSNHPQWTPRWIARASPEAASRVISIFEIRSAWLWSHTSRWSC